ncbi:rubrerythrin family protein, partial [Candidatus Bathyarchaeota archaeon]|nr:rubrerythrin family protein [Candidatus Bathyarchaeota archaeon]
MLNKETVKALLEAQRNEITEHIIYARLANSIKNTHNREILKRISEDELRHYNFWRKYTEKDVKPSRLSVWKYLLISRVLGLTFGIKLMERGEEKAQTIYEKIAKLLPEAKSIVNDEDEHERLLVDLIDEERLKYVGSMVLGLNDALVELTGSLAGLTFALKNTSLVAMAGLITGV